MKFFSELVFPCGENVFASEIFRKRHLHIPGAGKDVQSILPWGTLTNILQEHRFDERRLRLIKDGEIMSGSRYLRRRSFRSGAEYFLVNGVGLKEIMNDGAVLNLVAIDEICASIRQLALSMECCLGGFVSVGAYAATTATRGLDLHRDPHDVLVLHLSGVKQWSVFPESEKSPAEANPAWKAPWEYLLNPGDVLYIPKGWWHCVVTRPDPSLHLTFAITHRQSCEFLQWLMQKQGIGDIDVPRNISPEDQASLVASLRDTLATNCNQHSLNQFLADRYSALGNDTTFTLP